MRNLICTIAGHQWESRSVADPFDNTETMAVCARCEDELSVMAARNEPCAEHLRLFTAAIEEKHD